MLRTTAKALAVLVSLVIGSVALSGCTDSGPSTASEGSAATPSASPTPHFDPDDTLWTIASTGEHLTLDDPDVQALQQVVALHSGASDNRTPSTVADSVAAEEQFFSPLFLDKLAGEDYADAVTAMYVDNDLSIAQTGVAWTASTIDADRQHATVGFESLFTIVSASDGFLHELGADAGDEFAQPREYTLTKVEGAWLIDDIAKGPLRAAAATP
ncbi:hypothetical protein [Microbacterium sp. NPDC057944]|uniref:hypothetical protein n=1 Tax=Microbacterium sp. NPDC057944 TaxID=3346286 RepID=UPI0036DCA51E